MLIIDMDRCRSIKNRAEPDKQCPNICKYGDLCGIHHRCREVIRISPSEVNLKSHLIGKTEKEPEPEPESEFYDNVAMIQSTSIDEINYSKLLKTLKHYKIQIRGSKNAMIKTLINYIQNVDLISQAYTNTSLCNNSCDFYDFVELEQIPRDYLFIFLCADNRLYGMDIRSLTSYFEEIEKEGRIMERCIEYINPYNRYKLTSNTLCDYYQRIKLLQEKGLSLKYPVAETNPDDVMQFKVLEVFHIISSYGYAFDPSLFLKLERAQLLALYAVMDEIWNYRFGLSISQKKRIVGNDDINIFNNAEYHQIRDKSKLELQQLLVQKFEKMITSGIDRHDKINGVHYVLLGISDICENACLVFL